MKTLGRIRIVGVLCVVGVLPAACVSSPQRGLINTVETGRRYTDFQFTDSDGDPHYLHNQLGDYTVLAFTQCDNDTHIPAADVLQTLVDEHKEEEHVRVVGVDVHWSSHAMGDHSKCHVIQANGRLLSICDPTGGIRRLYGVRDSDWLFVIGPKRTIEMAYPMAASEEVQIGLRGLVSELGQERYWDEHSND